jgi:hypothetical protein
VVARCVPDVLDGVGRRIEGTCRDLVQEWFPDVRAAPIDKRDRGAPFPTKLAAEPRCQLETCRSPTYDHHAVKRLILVRGRFRKTGKGSQYRLLLGCGRSRRSRSEVHYRVSCASLVASLIRHSMDS